MSDFWQPGGITTIHRLPGTGTGDLFASAERFAKDRPVALLIPALASEMDGQAFPRIMEELKDVSFLEEVVLVLGRASGKEFWRARDAVENLRVKGTVVWPESPNLMPLWKAPGSGLDAGPPGKGRDVWIAVGYLLGRGGLYAVGLHDADIVTYTKELPLRLLAPLMHPDLEFAFCKGYYTRVSGKHMAGRVTRLLVVPLVSILSEGAGAPALVTIGAMRYALAGEFALTTDLAARIPVPRDWGLEVGILSSVSRAVPPTSICQAALCENYEHKHQELHPGDTMKGLNRMAGEVAAALLREAEKVPKDLVEAYRERALSLMPRYRADALVNGLDYDEERERKAVETFAAAVERALGPETDEIPGPLPAWQKAEEMVPGLKGAVLAAVEKDNS